MRAQQLFLFLLRISMGWLLFYAGITKVLNPDWSAAGYLQGATSFQQFYTWLASPQILPIVNFLNEWGLTLIGLSLIVGLFVRVSAFLGAVIMLLYYAPIVAFQPLEFYPAITAPYVGENSLLVDEHIIYAFVLLYLAVKRAGRAFIGLDGKILGDVAWKG